MSRKKRKKRVRVVRAPERQFLGSDEARFRLAARLSAGLGAVLLALALISYMLPKWNQALGASGNIALRLAGMALIMVSVLFGRLGK